MHNPVEILYEDNHLIMVNKPAGVPSQPDISGDMCMTELVKKYLKNTYNKPGNVFAGLIHRLDRPVSGVMVFAKTSKALERMNALFKNREVQKTYWAIVKNKPEKEEARLVHWLLKNSTTNKTTAFTYEIPDSQQAILNYRILKSSKTFFLLEITPLTGRPHQIRTQLAAIGCPIKGDVKYGYDRTNQNASGISLHARKIAFVHPIKKEALQIEAPLPNDDVWKYFFIS